MSAFGVRVILHIEVFEPLLRELCLLCFGDSQNKASKVGCSRATPALVMRASRYKLRSYLRPIGLGWIQNIGMKST